MRLSTLSLVLLLLVLLTDNSWIEPVQASFFSVIVGTSSANTLACGPSHSPCPESAPCCNNGICQKTSLRACSHALGCEPEYSDPIQDSTKKKPSKKTKSTDSKHNIESQFDTPQSCFPLPVCRSFTESFKNNKNKPDKKGLHQALIPKANFSGDPDQAHWTSDFDHVAPYAQIDPSSKRLVLKARRDAVKTQSGGGFGATVSSTRWNRYGTFSAKLKSGATGPGIVTAMMLSNPILGEEITIEVTGRDPKTVITDLFRHQDQETGSPTSSSPSSWLPCFKPGVPVPSMEGLRTRTRRLKDIILQKKQQKSLSTDTVVIQKAEPDTDGDNHDDSLEESHELKKSTAENDMVYKIEWTPDRIRWSVDKQVLRTLTSKDLAKYNGYGIPSHPMQLQLTIWDAGYSPETKAWAGGKTDYGKKDEKEYATLVEWIEISCYDSKESKRSPWPGAEATKRLEQAEKERKREIELREKMEGSGKKQIADNSSKLNEDPTKRGHLHHDPSHSLFSKNETGWVARVVDGMVRHLLRWSFVLVVLVGSAAYLTEPVSAQKHKPHQVPATGMKDPKLMQ